MPKTRVRPGAFTLDLGEKCNKRLDYLVKNLATPMGKISKTHVLRWLVDKEWCEMHLKKKSESAG